MRRTLEYEDGLSRETDMSARTIRLSGGLTLGKEAFDVLFMYGEVLERPERYTKRV